MLIKFVAVLSRWQAWHGITLVSNNSAKYHNIEKNQDLDYKKGGDGEEIIMVKLKLNTLLMVLVLIISLFYRYDPKIYNILHSGYKCISRDCQHFKTRWY